MNPSEIFNIDRFKQKLGPLPVWAWGLIIGVVGVLAYYLWKSRSTTSTTVDPGTQTDANFAAADKLQSQADSGFASYTAALEDAAKPPIGTTPDTPATPSNGGGYAGGGYDSGGSGYAAASYEPPIVTPTGTHVAAKTGQKTLGTGTPQNVNSYKSPQTVYANRIAGNQKNVVDSVVFGSPIVTALVYAGSVTDSFLAATALLGASQPQKAYAGPGIDHAAVAGVRKNSPTPAPTVQPKKTAVTKVTAGRKTNHAV